MVKASKGVIYFNVLIVIIVVAVPVVVVATAGAAAAIVLYGNISSLDFFFIVCIMITFNAATSLSFFLSILVTNSLTRSLTY